MDQRSQSHRPYPVCRNIMDNMEAWLILVCHVSKTRQIIPWSKDDKWGSKSVKDPDLKKWYQLLTFISGFMNDSALFSHDNNVRLELTHTNDDTSLITSPTCNHNPVFTHITARIQGHFLWGRTQLSFSPDFYLNKFFLVGQKNSLHNVYSRSKTLLLLGLSPVYLSDHISN